MIPSLSQECYRRLARTHLVHPDRLAINLDHVHDLYGVVCVIFTHELDKPVTLVLLSDAITRHVDIHCSNNLHRTTVTAHSAPDYSPTGPACRNNSHNMFSVTCSSRPPTYTVASAKFAPLKVTHYRRLSSLHLDSAPEWVLTTCYLLNSLSWRLLVNVQATWMVCSKWSNRLHPAL